MIQELLNRGVDTCTIKENLQERLEKGDKLRVKLGIDPTGSELHIGHAVILRKLRAFQDAGHQAILLYGTFTGQIGDPTGKDATRPPLTEQEVEKNSKNFLEQASSILDVDKLEIRKNGEWLNPMTFRDVVKLASSFTVQQMLHRDMYEKRIQENCEIALHEFLYPLMQGYDSVALKADVELGGTDQLFNLMAGRQIQKRFNKKPQDIMTLPILVGLDGKDKMSKSLGNYIGIKENPRDMFGKSMSIADKLMENWFELLTNVPMQEVKELLKGHPRDTKLRLAYEITKEFHNEETAQNAKEEFLRIFQDKGLPDNIPEMQIKKGSYKALDLIIMTKLLDSTSEARRMLTQNAVKVEDEKVNMEDEIAITDQSKIIQIGKRKFIKIKGQ
ncbi:MAG: tyrosine--tRNA ligase [Candidatus Gracilibacteria bacterium]|nr:tyrosine--tRNA ligase [Candidatus Gracilibacteria bacterium]